MSPSSGRARLTLALGVVAFVAVAALLGTIAWRLTPLEGPPLKRVRGPAREPLPEDASLVLITVDGLRADRLASYGEAPLSPARHLDRLATEGFRFEQAIAPAPQSFPSHAALLTGLQPTGRAELLAPAGALPPGRATLAEVLRSSGFHTAAFVGSAAVGRGSGLARGFDRFDEPRVADRPATVRWLAERGADEVAEAARAWLDENFRARFFLWVQLAEPAPPHPVPPERAGRRRDPYDAEVEDADAAVGRLIARLGSLGVLGHTVVVVAGSCGVALGEHGMSDAGLDLHDTTLRVPLILRLPGGAARDRSIPEQVRLFDLMPTLLDLLRLTAPEPPDGVSLVPLLDPGGTLLPLTAVVESVAGPVWLGRPRDRALRDGGWKWIESGRDELYDLRRDPGETRELSAAILARAREMRAALAAALHGGLAPDRPPVAAEAALLADGLAALRTADGARARTALEDLRRRLAAEGRPAPPGLLALIGGSLRLQNRPADALPLYEEALAASVTPETAVDASAGAAAPDGTAPASFVGMLHAEIGACRRIAGRTAAALESYRAAVTLRPDDPWDRLALADLLVDSGDPEAAIDELRAALVRAPGEGELLASLGRAYLAAEQPSAAILPLQDALRAAPGLTRPWFDLGRAYEGLGRSGDALRAYQDFTARVPEPGDPLFQQAAERMKALRAGA